VHGKTLFIRLRFVASARRVPIRLVICAFAGIVGGGTSVAAPPNTLIEAVTATSDGHSSVATEHAPDGRTKLMIRGDTYDGRRLLKAIYAGFSANDPAGSPFDLDLDIKVARLGGFNGEALRDVELTQSGQGGEITGFALAAKLGKDAHLNGEMRRRQDGRAFLYLETNDASAFFRFTNIFPRMKLGNMSIAIDVSPSANGTHEGLVNISHFAIVEEPAFDPLASWSEGKSKRNRHKRTEVSRLRLSIKLSRGHLAVDDGVMFGPVLGATAEGSVDLERDEVALRGVLIPRFAERFLGPPIIVDPDPNAGLISMSYQLTGPFRAPRLIINPFGPLAPGVLRRIFESSP
jgi:hypothetical protein